MRAIDWMQQALDLAVYAQAQGEVPVGAVLVGSDNTLLGSGWNQMISRQDPTAHAEIIAIQAAAKQLNNYRLINTTLYVTLEPCCMCAGAMVHARIQKLVFGTRDPKSGAAVSVFDLLKGHPLNHQVQVEEGVLQASCAQLLIDFFKAKRKGG